MVPALQNGRKMTTLKVLSAGAVKRGVAQIAGEFESATGITCTLEFAPAPELLNRVLAGDTADIYVAPSAVLDEFAGLGKIVAGSRGTVGRSRIGVVVHEQAPTPALGSVTAFRLALRYASKVVYNQASSGLYIAKLLRKLSPGHATEAKMVVVRSGAAVMEYVAAHPGAVGLAQIPEIMVQMSRGCTVRLAGSLPDEIQNLTHYEAAATSSQLSAFALVRALTSVAAKESFAATGIE